MKLRSVTTLAKRKKSTSKNFDDDAMSENREVIVFFLIFVQFRAVWRIPDTESAEVTFSVTVAFCLTKTEKRTKKSLTQLSHYCFE